MAVRLYENRLCRQQLLRVVGQQDTVSYIDAIKARSKVERAADPANKSGDARQP